MGRFVSLGHELEWNKRYKAKKSYKKWQYRNLGEKEIILKNIRNILEEERKDPKCPS